MWSRTTSAIERALWRTEATRAEKSCTPPTNTLPARIQSSAGSQPKGEVHPLALELLAAQGLPTQGLRSKSWDEFERPGAPKMDFIFTVCDNAAAETCPVWPGHPMTAHWGLPDPAGVEGPIEVRRKAFRDTLIAMQSRLRLFTSLPISKLDRLRLKRELDMIGTSQPADA